MDCRYDRKTRSLLRYVKWHDGEQERTIIDHFCDPDTRKRLDKLRKDDCLRRNKIMRVPDGVEGQSASLIGIEWFITDKGRTCLYNNLKSDAGIYIPLGLLGLAALTLIFTLLRVI